MKKIIAATAVLAAMSSAAMATDQDITLNATVDPFCTIGGSLTPGAIAQTIPTTSTGGVVTTAINVDIGTVTCNRASTVQLLSAKGGLFDPALTSAPSGFQNFISYGATISVPAASSITAANTAPAAATGSTGTSSGASADANVTVTITPTAASNPLLAGTGYTDTLTVRILPNG